MISNHDYKYNTIFDLLYYTIFDQGFAAMSLIMFDDGNFIACNGDTAWYKTWIYAKNDGIYEIDEDRINGSLIYEFTFEEINIINNLIEKFNSNNDKCNIKNMLDYLLYLQLKHTIFKTPTKSARR